ncbi:Mitogen-activated protein kinase kinase 2 [Tritrichomonas foetus]|uniref:mitogen-activated protein kinase kinase n=1 Tax=Tritrichomonas foetus TaxID=1144522 RepID=A0A1J4L1R3_9EUKA|nr:Mitogen-activated protein kinase kinase 2 [Tritrichomonas foetus]|eukprot:OHT17457.1 Mitogen-activated protein kinase kinase 2 [Tritrichomonas foetus]
MSSVRSRRMINLPQLRPDSPSEITAPPLPDENELTKDFPKIKINDLDFGPTLGHGASANVYRVTHRQTGKEYAIKKISFREKKEITQQVVTELHALRVLKHENIVQLYSAFYSSGHMYILMELIDGGSLSDILKVSPYIPEPVIGRLAYHVVQGLLYLRQHHYLHRDLKPSNILITQKGEVKIADFGMARQLDRSVDTAQSFLGTMVYMSPERLREEGYSFLSDIWSFGIIIYQCAVGKFPLFDAKNSNLWELISKLSSDVEVKLPQQYSAELTDFITGCLKINPNNRTPVDSLIDHPFLARYKDPAAQAPLLQWTLDVQRKIEETNKARNESLKNFT